MQKLAAAGFRWIRLSGPQQLRVLTRAQGWVNMFMFKSTYILLRVPLVQAEAVLAQLSDPVWTSSHSAHAF